MNATAPKTVVVDLEVAARKVLKDPKGLSGVSTTDLVALAEYALLDDEEPRLSPSLAAAIALVIETRQQATARAVMIFTATADDPEMANLKAEHSMAADKFADAFRNLQTLFETEFPK